MKLKEFRYVTKYDPFDNSFPHWSRKYEYPTVFTKMIDVIPEGKTASDYTVHNSSWGFDVEHHQRFKDVLEKAFGERNVTNTDIVASPHVKNSSILDITKKDKILPHKDKYDFVLNVSAIEEIPGNHFSYIYNLYSMVKPGGHLICTFDYPGIVVKNLELHLDKNSYEDRITYDGRAWGGPAELAVLLLVVQKI